MKHKVYRPEPVRVNPFFFEHLPATRDAATRAEADAVSSCASSSPSSPSPSWSPAPETGDAAVDRILWSIYTPAAYQEALKHAVDREDGRTHVLEKELAEKWEQVEAILALNTQRHTALTSSSDLLEDVDRMLFWTAQDVITRFNIDVSIGADTARTEAAAQARASRPGEYDDLSSRARITLDYSVMPVSHARPGATALVSGADGTDTTHESAALGSSESPGMHHAKAWTMDDEALLDYTRRPHHLRRLYAPLLQRRAELPKALTLLLNEVQTVQSQRLPPLERQVEAETMFTVPIYLPLQMIATFITRYLAHPSENEAIEASQVAAARAVAQRVDAFQQHVIETAPDEDAIHAMTDAERESAAREMWQQLFDELEVHRRYHEGSLRACAQMESQSAAAMHTMREAWQTCTSASRQAMRALEADAEACTAALTKSGSHTLEIVETVKARYDKDAARLSQSIQAKRFALEKSAETQEKLMRRVREAVKEVYLEQHHYQELTQEWLQEQLALKHLTSSYEQVKTAMQARHDEAVNARQHAESVHALLAEAEAVRQTLVTSCEQHMDRLETESFYRVCHVASQTVANVQQWSRAVGDMTHLYEARYAAIAGRLSNATWQMEYLMASERDWAVGNLLDVRKELVTVDDRWKEAMSLAARLDLFPEDGLPTLNEKSRTDATASAREAMRLLDDSKQVQRNVMTLKTFRARAADAPEDHVRDEKEGGAFAAGSGASAVLRLGKTASADASGETADMKAPSTRATC